VRGIWLDHEVQQWSSDCEWSTAKTSVGVENFTCADVITCIAVYYLYCWCVERWCEKSAGAAAEADVGEAGWDREDEQAASTDRGQFISDHRNIVSYHP